MSSLLEGWRRLGLYRTLPFFFALGAAVEWFMINVRVGKETFCKIHFFLGQLDLLKLTFAIIIMNT